MLKKITFALVFAATSINATAAEVNVYSERQSFLLDPIFKDFTQTTGIEVNTVFAKKGLLERLALEGEQSPADLVILANVQQLVKAKDDGLTQRVESDVLTSTVPTHLYDSDQNWFALTTRARIIATSLDRVADGAIVSYAQLADPKWNGKICTRSGKHPYMVALIAAQIAHNGIDSARNWLKGVKANLARKPSGNDRAQVKAVAAGECDIAVLNTYYVGLMNADPEQKQALDTVRIVFPDQQGTGTHVNISAAAMTRAAPNYQNAVKLLEFMVSERAQALYAQGNYEFPVRANTELAPIVASWGEVHFDTIALDQLSTYIDDASRLVDEVQYDR